MIPWSLLLALLIRSRVVGPLVTSRNNGLLIYIVKFLEITKVISSEIHQAMAIASVAPLLPVSESERFDSVWCISEVIILDSSSAGSSG